jgi:hypothetical protein
VFDVREPVPIGELEAFTVERINLRMSEHHILSKIMLTAMEAAADLIPHSKSVPATVPGHVCTGAIPGRCLGTASWTDTPAPPSAAPMIDDVTQRA